jgi:membrane-bound lytic murein transglycosylase C
MPFEETTQSLNTRLRQIGWPFLIALPLSSCTDRPSTPAIVPLDRIAEQIPTAGTGDATADIQQDAEQHLSVFCAQYWGSGNVWLPTQTQWVYYGEDWTSRGRVDFENGEFQAQAIIEPGKDTTSSLPQLRRIVDEAIQDRPADMARHDSTMRYVKRLAAKRGVNIDPVPVTPPPASGEPVLAGIIDPENVEVSSGTLMSTSIVGSTGKHWTQLTLRVPFKPGYLQRLAAPYADQVRQESNTYHLPMRLIFAVIEAESAFNPRATSPTPAYGLMQLVPTTAGRDAYQHVHGVSGTPGPEFLFNPVNNIKLGSAYLNLLDSKYLNEIEDPKSRLYATIAAYNTGAGNVARAFGTRNLPLAIQTINGMSPDSVYQHLRERLSSRETRDYLAKVTDAQIHYQNMNQNTDDAGANVPSP